MKKQANTVPMRGNGKKTKEKEKVDCYSKMAEYTRANLKMIRKRCKKNDLCSWQYFLLKRVES